MGALGKEAAKFSGGFIFIQDVHVGETMCERRRTFLGARVRRNIIWKRKFSSTEDIQREIFIFFLFSQKVFVFFFETHIEKKSSLSFSFTECANMANVTTTFIPYYSRSRERHINLGDGGGKTNQVVVRWFIRCESSMYAVFGVVGVQHYRE